MRLLSFCGCWRDAAVMLHVVEFLCAVFSCSRQLSASKIALVTTGTVKWPK